MAALVGGTTGSLAGAVAGAGPAAAAWGAAATRPAAQLGSAEVGAGFEVRPASGQSSGPGSAPVPQASPYAVGPALAGGPVLVDVVSGSSVPARVALVVTTGGVVSAEVKVQRCDVPWTGPASTATCSAPGGAVEVASTRVLTLLSSASASWSVDLPARGRQHLRVSRGALTVGATSLTATASPLGGGKDRTLG